MSDIHAVKKLAKTNVAAFKAFDIYIMIAFLPSKNLFLLLKRFKPV